MRQLCCLSPTHAEKEVEQGEPEVKSEIRRIEDLTGGEFSKQPIEPERIFREGEMGDCGHSGFCPLEVSRVTEARR